MADLSGRAVDLNDSGAAGFLHGANVGPLEFEAMVAQPGLKFRELLWSVADGSRGLFGRDGVAAMAPAASPTFHSTGCRR
jgi:hypothetical protein